MVIEKKVNESLNQYKSRTEQLKSQYNEENLDELFMVLKKNKSKYFNSWLRKDRKYIRYVYNFSRGGHTHEISISTSNTHQKTATIEKNLEEQAVKIAHSALDNIIPILDDFGHAELANLRINAIKVPNSNNYSIKFYCGEHELLIPASELQNIDKQKIETLIYKGVIKQLQRKIFDGYRGIFQIRPEYKQYINKYIENNESRNRGIIRIFQTYNKEIPESQTYIYTNPQKLKEENPDDYMAMAILFTGYHFDKKIKQDEAEKAKAIAALNKKGLWARVKDALVAFALESPDRDDPMYRDKIVFNLFAKAERCISEPGNPGNYTIKLALSKDGSSITGVANPDFRGELEGGNPGRYDIVRGNINKTSNGLTINLLAKAENTVAEPGNPGDYDGTINITKDGRINGILIPESIADFKAGNPGRYTLRGMLNPDGTLVLVAESQNLASEPGNPGNYTIKETLPKQVLELFQEYLK